MTNGSEAGRMTAGEILGELPLDLAWGSKFYEGHLAVSREAVRTYGMVPVHTVVEPSELDLSDTTEVQENIPRTHVTVVGPSETAAVAARILSEYGDSSLALGGVAGGIEEGRIDLILGFGITMGDSAAKKLAFFEEIYSEQWPAVDSRNRNSDFRYRMAHLVPDLATDGLEAMLPQYYERKGLRPNADLLVRYAASVGNSVHEVFCGQEHVPELKIPDIL